MGRLLSIALLFLPAHLMATVHWATQSGAGSADGSTLANAWSAANFNNSANWGVGSSKIAPGDTVFVSGTFTTALTVKASGSAGNITTIAFTNSCVFTAPIWASTGALILDGRSYITVEGSGTGQIVNTDNGTTLGHQDVSTGVSASGVWHVTIQNLIVTNIYQRTPGSLTDANRFGAGVSVSGSEIMVKGCTIGDGDGPLGVTVPAGVSSNIFIFNNTVIRGNHPITVATSDPGSFCGNIQISSNIVDYTSNWAGNNAIHLDPIFLFNISSDNSGTWSNVTISANFIGPHLGPAGTSTPYGTAGINCEFYHHQQLDHLFIVNNVVGDSNSIPLYAYAHIAVQACTNSLVANNTEYGGNVTGFFMRNLAESGGASQVAYSNNLVYCVNAAGTGVTANDANVSPGFMSDKNVYYGLSAGTPFVKGGSISTANWQADGYDNSSQFAQPAVDGNYVPTAGDTVARGHGANLSAPFTANALSVIDFYGNDRQPSAAWTIGAFENTNSVAASSAPSLSLSGATLQMSGAMQLPQQ